jgi:transcription elongation factor Elf1
MATITRKQVCSCKNCGNEAEMVVTCSLPEADTEMPPTKPPPHPEGSNRVKGTATCSHCGNEADMWIEL